MRTMTQDNKQGMTRRNVALGAGLAGAALVASKAGAQTTGANAGDIRVLNYALALEHLEANFYTRGLERFSAQAFGTATFGRILGPGTVQGVYTNLTRIRDHEVAHVQALQAAITQLGGTPVQACTYRFPYNTPDEFLQVAQTLEETGVMAYNGALAMLTNRQLMAAGAGITTVEARHAAYLNLVNSNIPFPKAFDEAKMMADILAAIAPFQDACPTPGGGSGTTGTKAVLLPKNLSTTSQQIQLDATQSAAADAGALTYAVRLVSGSAAITQGNTARPTVYFSGGFGDYVFELTVTDAAGKTATDTTSIRYVGV
ncbi:MAG TPA: ferritin-like domain-containing protein [Bryobacteraceae bacterium]|nr:ferritin-like domain-containing protein [Bryobacteraceae bacterium]